MKMIIFRENLHTLATLNAEKIFLHPTINSEELQHQKLLDRL